MSHPKEPQFAASDVDCGSCVDVLFEKDIARIVSSIQVAPDNNDSIGPFAHSIILSSIIGSDQALQESVPLRDLAGNSVAPCLFSTVLRC